MLTIRLAALAHDLDLARGRMQATMNNDMINAEWRDLTEEQKAMFLSIALVVKEMPHATAP